MIPASKPVSPTADSKQVVSVQAAARGLYTEELSPGMRGKQAVA